MVIDRQYANLGRPGSLWQQDGAKDRSWPRLPLRGPRRQLPLGNLAIMPKDCCVTWPRTHSHGHKRALACQENRVANDRFQSTAVVTRRPIVVTNSPKRSFIALRCNPASRTDRVSAGHGLELALPTQRRPWRFSGRTSGPSWNPSFAEVVEKSELGDSSRSQVTTSEPYKITAQWLHPEGAKWCCRPVAVLQRLMKQSFTAPAFDPTRSLGGR